MRAIIHGKVVAYRDGQYKTFVVESFDEPEKSWNKFSMLTICPNWQGTLPKLGDRGFFEYEEVNSGEKYYARETGEEGTYLYSGNYFMNFIEEPQVTESQKEFKF